MRHGPPSLRASFKRIVEIDRWYTHMLERQVEEFDAAVYEVVLEDIERELLSIALFARDLALSCAGR